MAPGRAGSGRRPTRPGARRVDRPRDAGRPGPRAHRARRGVCPDCAGIVRPPIRRRRPRRGHPVARRAHPRRADGPRPPTRDVPPARRAPISRARRGWRLSSARPGPVCLRSITLLLGARSRRKVVSWNAPRVMRSSLRLRMRERQRVRPWPDCGAYGIILGRLRSESSRCGWACMWATLSGGQPAMSALRSIVLPGWPPLPTVGSS